MRTLASFLVTMTVAGAVDAGWPPIINSHQPPLLLRLEGVVAPTRAAAKGHGFTVTSLQLLGLPRAETRYVGVTRARTHGGDNPVLGKDVLDAVAPFDPNFLAMGPAALLEKLAAAPAGARIELDGQVDRASRRYFVRSVRVGDEVPPQSG